MKNELITLGHHFQSITENYTDELAALKKLLNTLWSKVELPENFHSPENGKPSNI